MSGAATTGTTSQDVEMKDVEKTDNAEEVKKDPDILTLEGMLYLHRIKTLAVHSGFISHFCNLAHSLNLFHLLC